MHTIEKFNDGKTKIIVVLPQVLNNQWQKLCTKNNFKVSHIIAQGGKTRSESVKNGLMFVNDTNMLVAVHDASRPLVSKKLINNLFDSARENGNAIPCIPVTDSLRMKNGIQNIAADRSKFMAVQTPQVFKASVLKNAFSKSVSIDYSDEASLVEASGEKINVITGEISNIKITYAFDLAVAHELMQPS